MSFFSLSLLVFASLKDKETLVSDFFVCVLQLILFLVTKHFFPCLHIPVLIIYILLDTISVRF